MQPNLSCWVLTLSPPTLYHFKSSWHLLHTTKIGVLSEYLYHHYLFKECVVCLWNFQVVTSLPHFQLDSEDLTNNHTWFLHQLMIAKSIGKHAQLLFRHQSTSRLTSNFCHINPSAQWKVKIKPFLVIELTPGHLPLTEYKCGCGKTFGPHSQHLPHTFVHYHLLTDLPLFFNYRQW